MERKKNSANQGRDLQGVKKKKGKKKKKKKGSCLSLLLNVSYRKTHGFSCCYFFQDLP